MGTDFVEFQQLQEVGIFSYLVYSLVKSHFYGWGFVEAWMVVLSVSKSLNRLRNPYLCGREQCRPEGFTIHVIGCVTFVLLGDLKLIA